MKLRTGIMTASAAACLAASAAEPPTSFLSEDLLSRPAYPVVREGGYVLLEIWPTVRDITVSAFFLDDRDEKSRNLCESVKKSLDHDAEIRAREQNTTFSSYRKCMTIRDAARDGWIESKD
jgi:hypothetical protein